MTAEQPETKHEEIPRLAAAHLLAIDVRAQRAYELSLAHEARESALRVMQDAQRAADMAAKIEQQANDALQDAFARKVQAMAEAQS